MHFGFNPDQVLMGTTMRRALEEAAPFDRVQQFAKRPQLDPKLTRALADTGALGLCAPQDAGGLALGAVDAVAVLIECGRNLTPWPVAETIAALAALGDRHMQISQAIASGQAMATVAIDPGISASRQSDGWRLTGALNEVPWVSDAQWLLAEVDAGPSREKSLALIDLRDPSLEIIAQESFDLSYRIGRVVLPQNGLAIETLLEGRSAALKDLMAVFAAAEMLGAAGIAFEKTVDYLKQRQQFGRAIGTFQALKHIAADDAVRIENMSLAVLYAAHAIDIAAEDADMAVALAKSYCAQAARQIASHAIQLHGGIGYTWEFGLHLYLRRVMRCAASSGTTESHREALAAALLDTTCAAHPAAAPLCKRGDAGRDKPFGMML
jgi:alkylation response protein AidB-like acyl-CoA dehydrogenase